MNYIDDIIQILSTKLPLEIVIKILYYYKGIQTPSCKAIKSFLKVVKLKFYRFDDISSIKLRVLKPKKLLEIKNEEEWEQYYDLDENVNKIIIVTYQIKNISLQKVFRRRIYLFT